MIVHIVNIMVQIVDKVKVVIFGVGDVLSDFLPHISTAKEIRDERLNSHFGTAFPAMHQTCEIDSTSNSRRDVLGVLQRDDTMNSRVSECEEAVLDSTHVAEMNTIVHDEHKCILLFAVLRDHIARP